MDLFEEEEQKLKPKERKKIKSTTILLIFIILLSIITVAIYCLLMQIKGTILKVNLNGASSQELKQVLVVNGENVEVPIKAISKFLGYEAYSGDYLTLTVDENKSYVKNLNQVTMFSAESKVIKQILLEDNSSQNIIINEEIIKRDGEFYTTIEGARAIFNIYFNYDKQTNTIDLITLDQLYANYLNYYVSNYGFVGIEETFENKKAILENMMILKTSNGKCGVISTQTGQMILETQYDEIKYISNLKSFLVTGKGLKGIISKEKDMIVDIEYRDIKIIRNEENNKNYYLVTTNNNLNGIIDETGKVVIYPEYNQIGYDMSNFSNNDINNEYILFGKIIPVKKGNLWAIFDMNGKQITEFQYTNLGCTANIANSYKVIQIPEFELIVVSSADGKYDLITAEGKNVFGYVLSSVYKTVNLGKNYYYIVANGSTIELMPYLEKNGIKRVN